MALTTSDETSGAPPLSATDLYRFYHAGDDETLALRGVSLRLDRGEIVAVMGPSGSGKSTLLACLAGLDDPDGGSVRCLGEPMSRRREAERAALRARTIGMLFQSNNLLDCLSVKQNVTFAQRLAGRVDARAAEAILDEVGIAARGPSLVATLSGGETARAGLAVALANKPAIVLADEPTGELDQANADRLMALLRARADRGTAVLFVTHSSAAAEWADRVLHMRDGHIDAEVGR